MQLVSNNNNMDRHENDHIKGFGSSIEINVRKIINSIVIITNNILVLKLKFDEANILGIIIKIMKGFVIPPVK